MAAAGQVPTVLATEFLTSKRASVSGEIIRYTSSTVTIRTDFGSMLMLPKSDVESIRYSMRDGSKVEGPLQTWDDGVYVIDVDGKHVAVKDGAFIADGSVAETTPPDPQTAVETSDPIAEDRPTPSASSKTEPVEISASVEATSEAASTVSFDITLSEQAPVKIVLLYTTINGTAKAGQDYEAMKGVLVIPAGTTSSQLEVPLIDDDEVEGDETVKLFLSSSPAVATISQREIFATITDDDD